MDCRKVIFKSARSSLQSKNMLQWLVLKILVGKADDFGFPLNAYYSNYYITILYKHIFRIFWITKSTALLTRNFLVVLWLVLWLVLKNSGRKSWWLWTSKAWSGCTTWIQQNRRWDADVVFQSLIWVHSYEDTTECRQCYTGVLMGLVAYLLHLFYLLIINNYWNR